MLVGYWTEDLRSLLAVSQRLLLSLPCEPLHRTALSMATGFIRVSRQERGRLPDGSHSFYNLISQVVSITSVILFFRSKLLGLGCIQWEKTTQGCECWGGRRASGTISKLPTTDQLLLLLTKRVLI